MSIPKIYRFGDRHTTGILENSVVVEEKIDGSQFSFCTSPVGLVCMSKNTVIDQADPGMFKQAVETAQRIHGSCCAMANTLYQCEFVARPKHNVLTYSRTPKGFLVLFDIRDADGTYRDLKGKQHVADNFGIECVRTLYSGPLLPTQEWLPGFLDQDSQLGGCKVEGIVIKNYSREHAERPGHPLTAKIVSEAFKEVKKQDFVVNGKSEQREKLERAIMPFRTTARWLKAVQHLREAGKLAEEPKDIGPLLAEVWRDTINEETEAIKNALFAIFQRDLRVNLTKGFPEWYLSKLENGYTVFETEEVLNKN